MATGSVLAGWGVRTTLEACPEAVRKVVEAKVDDGLVDEVRMRTVDGKVLYLVEIERPEYRDIELYLRPDGTVQEARHEMKWDDVPEKVREMAAAKTPTNGKIDDAMRRTLHGKDESDATYVIEYDRVDAPDLHLELAADGTEVGRVDEIED